MKKQTYSKLKCKPSAIECIRIAEAPPVLAVETCFRQQRYDEKQLVPKIMANSSSSCCDSHVILRQSRGICAYLVVNT